MGILLGEGVHYDQFVAMQAMPSSGLILYYSIKVEMCLGESDYF